jgi:hypothetical protein
MQIRLLRLPDINSNIDRYGFRAYGRFALLRNGSIWFGDIRSCHPFNCQIGWYWAIANTGELLVSARGAGIDGDSLFRERKPVLAALVEELVRQRILSRPNRITIEI